MGGLRSVRMSGGGDPLFHSGILDFLDHLDARGVLIDNLTTNGALLGPEIARRLVARGTREVIFSVNAVDDQDYHRMMQVPLGTFGRVLTNIRGLLAERGDAELPSVVVQFLVDRENFREIPRMYALGRSLGADRVVISNVAAIPLGRIGEGILLGPGDALAIAPYLEEVLAADKPDKRLQLAFPIGEWNVLLEEIKRKLDYGADRETFPMAPSFQGGERPLLLFLVHGHDPGKRRPLPVLPPDASGLQAPRERVERQVRRPLGRPGIHGDAARAEGDPRSPAARRGSIRESTRSSAGSAWTTGCAG